MKDIQSQEPKPACYSISEWAEDGGIPSLEDFEKYDLLDFSDPANARKTARIISLKNGMEDAAILTGELSYVYRHGNYDVASMAECLIGIASEDDYNEVIKALDDIGKPGYSSALIHHLIEAVKRARDISKESQ